MNPGPLDLKITLLTTRQLIKFAVAVGLCWYLNVFIICWHRSGSLRMFFMELAFFPITLTTFLFSDPNSQPVPSV